MAPPPRMLARAGWSVLGSVPSKAEPQVQPNSSPGHLEAEGARLVGQVAACWSSRYIHTIRRHGVKDSAFHYEALFSQPTNSKPVPGVVISCRFALVVPKDSDGLGQEPRLFYSFEEGDLRHEWALERDLDGCLQIVRGQQVISIKEGYFERFLDSLVAEKENVRGQDIDLVTDYEATRLPPPSDDALLDLDVETPAEVGPPMRAYASDYLSTSGVGGSPDVLIGQPMACDDGSDEMAVAMLEALRAAGLACDKVQPPSTLSELLVNVFDAADEDNRGEMPHYEVARVLGATLPGFGLEEWDIHLLLTSAQENDDGFIECKPFIQAAPEVIHSLRKRRIAYRAKGASVHVPREAVNHCFSEEVGLTVDLLAGIFEQCAQEDPERGIYYYAQVPGNARKHTKSATDRRESKELSAQFSPTPTGAEGEEQVLMALKRRFCRECLLQLPERLSPQEVAHLMQMLQEDEDGFVYVDDLAEMLERLRTDALLNALVETDVGTLRHHLILKFRQLGLQEDGKMKLWLVKNALLQADQICLSRLQIHVLLCLVETDMQGNVDIRKFLGMCCAIVPHMCDARIFAETAEKLQADDAEATRRKENAELALLQAAKVATLAQDVEEKAQENEVDQETVERTLQQVLTLADDGHSSTLPPEKCVELLLGGTDVQVQSCQLRDFELCGFLAEMNVDPRNGQVAYVDHVKRWVPVIFEVRKSLLLGAYLKDDSAEHLGIKEPNMAMYEREFPMFPHVVGRMDTADVGDLDGMMRKMQSSAELERQGSGGAPVVCRRRPSKEAGRRPSKEDAESVASSVNKKPSYRVSRSKSFSNPPSRAPSLEPSDRLLTVRIISARGLRNADTAMKSANFSDPYCVCEIMGKPRSKVRTPVIDDQLDPVWNFEAIVPTYERGDALTFTVMDKDIGKRDDMLGRCTITGAQIQFGGMEGEIPLQEAGDGVKAFLTVRVIVDPPYQENPNDSNAHKQQAMKDRLLCPSFKYLGEPELVLPKGRGYERRKLLLEAQAARQEAERQPES